MISNHSGPNTTTATSSAVVADAPLFGQSLDVQATAGATFTTILATFGDSDPRPISATADLSGFYTASVNWGDGTTGPGQVVINTDGGFLVKGTHAYQPGSYTVTTTVVDVTGKAALGDAGSTLNLTASAVVADSPITVALKSGLVAGQGVSQFIDLGSFTTTNLLATNSQYAATVTYGDGTQGPATVSSATISKGLATFEITTTKTYAQTGAFRVLVSVTQPGGATAAQLTSVTVTSAPVTATGLTVSGVSKTPLSGLQVANFTSGNPSASAKDYSATIHWGDNTTSAGTIVSNGQGGFQVVGDHTFAEGGSFPLTVVVSGTGVSSTATGSATIGDLLTPITGGVETPTGPVSGSAYTNANRPVFSGTAEPNSTVEIFAQPVGGGSPALVGTGTADSTGHFAVTSNPIGDGQYTVAASAVDASGRPAGAMTTLYPSASRGVLTVDTQGPKVFTSALNPRTGKVTVEFTDGLSGLGTEASSTPPITACNRPRDRDSRRPRWSSIRAAPRRTRP